MSSASTSVLENVDDSTHPNHSAHSLLSPTSLYHSPYLLILILILTTLIFFKSILPRIPRLLLRGPLRIKRLGLRGIRGLEFRSNGFNSKGKESGKEEGGGLQIRVGQIKPIFFWNEMLIPKYGNGNVDEGKAAGSNRRKKALLTIYIKGISIYFPSSSSFSNQTKLKNEKLERERKRKEEEEKKVELEKEIKEERLRILLQSPPLSPSLTASSSDHLLDFSTSLEQKLSFSSFSNPKSPTTTSSSYYPTRSSIQSSYNSILHLITMNSNLLLPKIRKSVLRSIKSSLYLITSALPILASLMDVRIEDLEILHQDSDLCLRIQKIETLVEMNLVRKNKRFSNENLCHRKNFSKATTTALSEDGEEGEEGLDRSVQDSSSDSSSDFSDSSSESSLDSNPEMESKTSIGDFNLLSPLSKKFSSALYKVPGQVGTASKGAFNYLLSGIPAGKASVQFQFDGLDAFEISSFKSQNHRKPKNFETSRSTFNLEDRNPSFSSSSSSKNRWNDWTFSHREILSSSNWKIDSEIPTKSKILTINSFSIQSSVLLGQSFKIQKEALGLKIKIPEISLGLDAVSKVFDELQKKQERMNFKQREEGEEEREEIDEEIKEEKSQENKERNDPSTLEASKTLETRRRKNSTASTLLGLLGTFSLSIPTIKIHSNSTGPQISTPSINTKIKSTDSLQINAILQGLKFSIKTSDHGDELHQYWLGSCGVKNFHDCLVENQKSDHKLKKSFYRDRIGGIAQRIWKGSSSGTSNKEEKIILIEKRRVFQVDFNLPKFEVGLSMNDDEKFKSKLLDLKELKVHLRSSWTPFGILPSSSLGNEVENPSLNSSYFENDPNEHAVVGEIGVQEVGGDIKLEHLETLLRFAELRKNEIIANIQNFNLSNESHFLKPKPSRAAKSTSQSGSQENSSFIAGLPRLALSTQFNNFFYQMSAKRREVPANPNAPPQSTLIISLPRFASVFHGNYKESFSRRSEVERRNGWKKFKKNQLEFDVYSSKKIQETSNKGTSQRKGSFLFGNTERTQHKDDKGLMIEETSELDSPEEEFFPSPIPTTNFNINQNQKKSLTMDEALKEMKNLQKREERVSRSSSVKPPSFSPASTMEPSLVHPPNKNQKKHSLDLNKKSLSTSSNELKEMDYFNINYHLESNFNLETFDVYLKTPRDCSSSSYFEDSSSNLPKPPQTPAEPSGLKISKYHLVSLHHLEVSLNSISSGLQDQFTNICSFQKKFTSVDVRCSLEDIDLELWRPAVLENCSAIVDVLVHSKDGIDPTLFGGKLEAAKVEEEGEEEEEEEPSPIIDRLPTNLALYFTVGLFVAHVGGNDARCDAKISRGVGFESKRVVLEYTHCRDKLGARSIGPSKYSYGSRSALDLPEDIKISAFAHASRHGKAAIAKINLYEIGLFPILDADQAVRIHEEQPKDNPIGKNENVKVGKEEEEETQNEESNQTSATPSVFAPAVWDFQTPPQEEIVRRKRARKMFKQNDRSNFIFWLPFSATVITIRPPGSISSKVGKSNDEITIVTEQTKHISIKIELLHTYCLLVAAASLRSLVPKGSSDGQSIHATPKSENPKKKKKSITPSIHASLFVDNTHCSVALPHFVNLFIAMRRVDVRFTEEEGFSISWESLMGAGETAQAEAPPDLWEEIARFRDWKIVVGRKEPSSEGMGSRSISINGDVASIRIPYNYILHDVIENALVAFKATKQLAHQFVSGKDDSIISPVEEDPKHLPKIFINLRILTLEAQDDPLETRLNLIWRAGSDEQAARAERDSAFKAKVETLRKEERSKSKASLSTSASSSVSSDDDEEGSGNGPTSKAQISIEEAQERLDAFNSSNWIRRFTNAKAEQGRREDHVLRRIHGRYPQGREASELPIKMAKASHTAPLLRSSMNNVSLEIGPPSFPETELRDFLFEQGQGVPKDMKYSTLVPLGIHWRMSEWRVELRDYPLPLLHIPPMHKNQDETLRSWDLKANVVFAEQLGGIEATRHVPAVVVPAATGHPEAVEYGIMIPKVAMPVKCLGSPVVKINTAYPTRLVWGQSIQPTISDVQRVFDSITSPPHDPSPRLGFWDKLPLIMHGKIRITFNGEGDLHIYLKGSRDPYNILGHGSGWAKCWRGNVDLRLGFDNKDQEFFQVTSDEYLLAIPDLKDYIDEAAVGSSSSVNKSDEFDRKSYGDNSLASTGTRRYMKDPAFTKVVVRLTNGIRWGVGLKFEHTCTDEDCERSPKCEGTPFYRECRRFGRIPHWDVHAKSKEYVNTLPKEEQDKIDSYKGWRSHHIHFSISVYSPEGGLPGHADGDHQKKGSPNNFFFTPLAWEHFWAWTRLFNSAMGLPIRNGSLFPNTPEPSPKFGQHLGTLKYRFDLAPLFITHCYMQLSDSDWAKGTTTLLGVKARIGTFHLDFHQRQQETVKDKPQLGGPRKVLHKPFYEAEVDCADIDLRSLVSQFKEPEKRLVPLNDQDEGDQGTDFFAGDYSIPDSDLEWVDMNDFVEVDWSPPEDDSPKIKLGQVLICPRFNYYRHVDSKRERRARNAQHEEHQQRHGPEEDEDRDDEEAVSRLEHSKFGKEKTHTCLVGEGPSAPSVQAELAKDRLEEILHALEKLENSDKTSNFTPDQVETQSEDSDSSSSEKAEKTFSDGEKLKELHLKAELLTNFIENVQQVEEARKTGGKTVFNHFDTPNGSSNSSLDVGALYRDWETFQQRFFVHNPTIFFNNSTRDVLLKYYLSSRARRGFCHQMTARALRSIRDLYKKPEAEEDKKGSRRKSDATSSSGNREGEGADLLHGLLNDTMHYVEEAEASQETVLEFSPSPPVEPGHGISKEFSINKSSVCVLLKPQIVLRSERDKESSIVITAIRGRLQNYSVRDENLDDDSVNERALYRNFASLDGLQAFHPNTGRSSFLKPELGHSGFAFVPLEVLLDSNSRSRDFDRVVPLTDASMQYDKFNRLRMNDCAKPVADSSCKDDASTDHLRYHMDLLRVQCPRFAVSANGTHFAALYNVVFDLLLYRDPSHRDHVKRLETMLFSYDFSDPAGLAFIVADLQNRIRHAGQLHTQYQLNFEHLNEQGRLDFLSIKAEALELIRELGLIHEAITTSQDQAGKDKDKKSAIRFEAHAQDIAWNMMGDSPGELLAKLALKGASFTWLNKADNSTANTFSLVDLQALNVRPDAIFTEIITKHSKASDHPMAKEGRFLNAMWSVLAPVGGIAIIDQFEFNLHPTKIQLEIKVGRQIMDYIFGSARRKEKELEDKKKKEEEEEAAAAAMPYDDKKKKKKSNPFVRLKGGSSRSSNSSTTDFKVGGSSSSKDKTSSSSKKRTSESRSRPSTPDTRKGAESEGSDEENSQMAITNKEAEEMRNRASASSTFVYVKISETTFCLSYKGEKQKSITDVYDLVFQGPTLEYRNRTWGYVDLANNFKRDIIRAAWSQKTTLLKGILSHRPRRKAAKENIRNIKSQDPKQQGLTFNIEPPTPRGSLLTEAHSSSTSLNAEEDVEEHGFGAHAAQAYQVEHEDSDEEDDEDEEEDGQGHGSEGEEINPDSSKSMPLTSPKGGDLGQSNSFQSDSLTRSLSGKSITDRSSNRRRTISSSGNGNSSASPSRIGLFIKKLGRNRSGSGSSSTLMGSVGNQEESNRSPDRERNEEISTSRSNSSSLSHKSPSGELMPPPNSRRSPERSNQLVNTSSPTLRKSHSVSALRDSTRNSSTTSFNSDKQRIGGDGSGGSPPPSSSTSLRNVLLGSPSSKSKLRLDTEDLGRRSSQESSRSSLFSGMSRNSNSKKNSPFEEMSDDEKREMLLG